MSKSPGINRRLFLGAGLTGVAALGATAGSTGYVLYRFNRVSDFAAADVERLAAGADNALLRRYLGLRGRLPWRPLGALPTPVQPLPTPGPGRGRLFVKRDDLTSTLYGGNKVRKLEHLLAEAELAGAGQLITMGGIGSNQALATALHGGTLGFDVALSLFDQPLSTAVRRNLRGYLEAGATVRYAEGIGGSLFNARRQYTASASPPYFIPAGGSNRLGNVGFVTAALELADQVQAGELPPPDDIVLAAGTCGTAAGLVAGLRLAGLNTRVLAVQVADPLFANATVLRLYAEDVLRYLRGLDPALPDVTVGREDFTVLSGYLGPEYGAATPKARAAVDWAAPQLKLETTYTGKALAACLDHCRGPGRDRNVLFWNTYNSRPFAQAEALDGLPAALRRRLQAA